MPDHDVIVVGSGVAGPTAAVLLARQGLSVALLEAHRDPAHYKRLCTHFLQSSGLPVLEELGIDGPLEAAGAVRNAGHVWSRYGWVHEPPPADRPPHGYNVRRQVLDPMLRELAAATDGITLLLGTKVRELLRAPDGRVRGVQVRDADGDRELTAHLVVGADGKQSTVATQAGLPAKEIRNNRLVYFAHYRGIELPEGVSNQMWLTPPDVAYVFGNDDGITLLAAMPDKARLPDFDADREAALLARFDGLPDAPDLSRIERVSDIIGSKDYPSTVRPRISAPGVALVGDAAMVGDPLWGVGCGFALQTASWLAGAVGPAMATATDGPERSRAADKAAASYARRHKLRLRPHQLLMTDFSSGRDFNPLERLLFAGAVHDPRVAHVFSAFGTRNASPAALLSPVTLGRAAIARRRARANA